MDEPCSALDPIATAQDRGADRRAAQGTITASSSSPTRWRKPPAFPSITAFFHLGKLIETGPTEQIFTMPKVEQTHDYITGRFG
jgi:phosphate transport system ATP-binding protein